VLGRDDGHGFQEPRIRPTWRHDTEAFASTVRSERAFGDGVGVNERPRTAIGKDRLPDAAHVNPVAVQLCGTFLAGKPTDQPVAGGLAAPSATDVAEVFVPSKPDGDSEFFSVSSLTDARSRSEINIPDLISIGSDRK